MLRKVLERDPALGWATRKLALLRASRRNDRPAWDEALRLIGPEARPDETPDDLLTLRGRVRARARAEPPPQGQEILEQLAVELPKRPPFTSCWPGSRSPRVIWPRCASMPRSLRPGRGPR